MWPRRNELIETLRETNSLLRALLASLGQPLPPRARQSPSTVKTAEDVSVVTAEIREKQRLEAEAKTAAPWRGQGSENQTSPSPPEVPPGPPAQQ